MDKAKKKKVVGSLKSLSKASSLSGAVSSTSSVVSGALQKSGQTPNSTVNTNTTIEKPKTRIQIEKEKRNKRRVSGGYAQNNQ